MLGYYYCENETPSDTKIASTHTQEVENCANDEFSFYH